MHQKPESALDALTAIVTWAEHDLGVIIDRPEDGGAFGYHLHDTAGCHQADGVSGFATASAAITAGLDAKVQALVMQALDPYLNVMSALDDAGVIIEVDNPHCNDPLRYRYVLAGGRAAGGFETEVAALEAALKQVLGPDGRRGRRPGAPLAIAA